MMHENIVIISRVKKVLTFAKFQQVAFFCFSLMVLEDSPPQKFKDCQLFCRGLGQLDDIPMFSQN